MRSKRQKDQLKGMPEFKYTMKGPRFRRGLLPFKNFVFTPNCRVPAPYDSLTKSSTAWPCSRKFVALPLFQVQLFAFR